MFSKQLSNCEHNGPRQVCLPGFNHSSGPWHVCFCRLSSILVSLRHARTHYCENRFLSVFTSSYLHETDIENQPTCGDNNQSGHTTLLWQRTSLYGRCQSEGTVINVWDERRTAAAVVEQRQVAPTWQAVCRVSTS